MIKLDSKAVHAGGKLMTAAALLAAMSFANNAMACSLANWSDSSGAVVANQPDGAAGDPAADSTAVARYEGLCGLRATGQGYVQDNRPNGINRIVTRFYVLNELGASQTATVYEGFGDEAGGSARFNVTIDDANMITLTDTTTGQSVSQAGDGGWDSVQLDWGSDASAGFISLSVNGAAAAETTGLSNAGGLESVRMGNLNGATGNLNFDAYLAQRSTATERVCNCNANGSADDQVNVQDVVVMVSELSGNGLAQGTPDCNETGTVDIQDIVLAVNLVSGAGTCVQ
ncbi:MAG: hypothetical protein MI750_01660 [Xanthomonadales bacterium]|jgi:hypothetical protein|nr:hypothetical protein [Xanthomonadales bacterium]